MCLSVVRWSRSTICRPKPIPTRPLPAVFATGQSQRSRGVVAPQSRELGSPRTPWLDNPAAEGAFLRMSHWRSGVQLKRLARPFCLGAIAVAVWACPARPQDVDQSLRLYAVHVVRVPKEPWTGNGVYLGKGLVLTAAHVVGFSLLHKVMVEIAGQDLLPKVLKEGRFADVDLTLLSVDESQLPVSLRLRRMTLCKQAPWPSEQVIVAIPEGIARSHVIAPALLPYDLAPKFRTAISDVATTGNSGSGVFDANRKCLLGIVSAKISQIQTRQENGGTVTKSHDVAKYFVPAQIIAEFIPPELR